MKTLNSPSLNFAAPMATVLACTLAFQFALKAEEEPAGCSFHNGGNGATFVSGINFALAQAHVGDDVVVYPKFGMIVGACRAIHVTGTVHIATGVLTNFFNDDALDPGNIFEPPVILRIIPELIGKGVSSPHGSVPGVPGTVRAVENVDGLVLSGSVPEEINDALRSATITIVNPAIQVVQYPVYPQGQTCSSAGETVQYSGYVTNAGDITLTNVILMGDRTGQVQLLNPLNGQSLPPNVTLLPGAIALFSIGFTPTADEISARIATSQLTVTARDTTTIGGPNASVTNSTLTASSLCEPLSRGPALTNCQCLANGTFQFEVVGQADKTYLIQATSNLNSPTWVTIGTLSKSLKFEDTDAASHPVRFYRAVESH